MGATVSLRRFRRGERRVPRLSRRSALSGTPPSPKPHWSRPQPGSSPIYLSMVPHPGCLVAFVEPRVHREPAPTHWSSIAGPREQFVRIAGTASLSFRTGESRGPSGPMSCARLRPRSRHLRKVASRFGTPAPPLCDLLAPGLRRQPGMVFLETPNACTTSTPRLAASLLRLKGPVTTTLTR